MEQPPHKKDPLPFPAQSLKVVGHGLFSEPVFRGPDIVSVSPEIGLVVNEMTDFREGVGVGHRGAIQRVAFSVPVYKVDGEVVLKGQS